MEGEEQETIRFSSRPVMSTGETAREQSPQSFQHIPAKISPVLREQLYLNRRTVRDTVELRYEPEGGGPERY